MRRKVGKVIKRKIYSNTKNQGSVCLSVCKLKQHKSTDLLKNVLRKGK